MKHFRAIIVFGVLLPAAFWGSLWTGFVVTRDLFMKERDRREALYRAHQENVVYIEKMEPLIPPMASRALYLIGLMDGDQFSQVGEEMQAIERRTSQDALVREVYRKAERRGAMASQGASAETLEMAFAGKFAPIQQLALNLESSRQNLVLDAFDLEFQESSPEKGFNHPFLALRGTYSSLVLRTQGDEP